MTSQFASPLVPYVPVSLVALYAWDVLKGYLRLLCKTKNIRKCLEIKQNPFGYGFDFLYLTLFAIVVLLNATV